MCAAVAVGLSGCRDTFECAADSQCAQNDVAGFCEPQGWCSFPDEECDSGRRFGGLAGTLSNTCVPAEDTSTGMVASTTTAGASGALSTGPMPPGSTSVDASSSGGDAETSDASGGAETTTSTVPTDCNVAFFDDFDAAELGPEWTTLGQDFALVDGELVFTIPPMQGISYDKARLFPGGVEFVGASVTFEYSARPMESGAQGTLTFYNGGDGPAPFVLLEGGVSLIGPDDTRANGDAALTWVRVEVTTDGEGQGQATLLQSADGIAWMERGSVPMLDTHTSLEFTAGTYQDTQSEQTFAVRSIEVCLSSAEG